MPRKGGDRSTGSKRNGGSTPRLRLTPNDLAALGRLRLPGETFTGTLRRAIQDAERYTAILQTLARIEAAVTSASGPTPTTKESPREDTPSKLERMLAATDEDRWG